MTEVTVRLADLPAFQAFMERVADFICEYAWHSRSCAAINADGEWSKGNPDCTCGYDEDLAHITQEAQS